ncbi:putative phage abortive infection protein [Maribellus sp. YY47]|uniref:putative phage abortive infection protein n=1 Tax=Maribellus sp. YY47 TaxID=2929486 RepID=UPI002000F0AA|nr:putative phage abortive infection protein [Maribellus sp. YY47]MCK3683986.1 putative phage abortive infection protein [Maribellus sp. YY47]
MKKIKTFDTFFWWSAAAFILVVALISFFPAWFTASFSKYNFTTTGQIGDTIGGIMGPFIAIAAAALTFLAFWVQYKANEQQKQDIKDLKERGEIEKLEAKFFELVKLHRDNVSELTYSPFKRVHIEASDEDIIKEEKFEGRKVFRAIDKEFKSLFAELKHFFQNTNEINIYEEYYLNQLKKNNEINLRNIDFVTFAQIDILYSIIYFGLSFEGQKTLGDFFKGRYKQSFFESIIQFASLKPKEDSGFWNKWHSMNSKTTTRIKHFNRLIQDWNKNVQKIEELRDEWQVDEELEYKYKYYKKGNYTKYYGGHQFRLGHYFRNLYQTITLINDDKRIDFVQKYSNIKILRGQLSTFEQTIIFLNSLSSLGRVWEFESRNNPEKAIEKDNQLITKYNFIKNILNDEIIEGVYVSHFYPLVEFESGINEEKKKQRELLEKQYS